MSFKVPSSQKSPKSKVIGRLAPSPTGALHLGNARSFLLAWLSTRSQNGKIILRIEDIDSPRVKPWAKKATIEDLSWLGIDWDEGPDPANLESENDVYIQTNQLERYRETVRDLIEQQKIYPCVCSRTDIANALSAPHESNDRKSNDSPLDGQVYPGTCRERALAIEDLPAKHAWRWKLEPGNVEWRDELLGPQSLDPVLKLGDFVVAKSDLTPSYQLAVVADDHKMDVTEVVRGDDLIYSTYRQLAILKHLGIENPKYFHVPLVVGPDGRRLAKRHGDTRLKQFRDLGVSSRALVGYLAWTLGFLNEPRPIEPRELLAEFNWQAIPLRPTVFSLADDLPKLLELSSRKTK